MPYAVWLFCILFLSSCTVVVEPLIIDVDPSAQNTVSHVSGQSYSKAEIEVILPHPSVTPTVSLRPIPMPMGTVSAIPSLTPPQSLVNTSPSASLYSPPVREIFVPPILPVSVESSPPPIITAVTPGPSPSPQPMLEQNYVMLPEAEYLRGQPPEVVVKAIEAQLHYAPSQLILLYGGSFVVNGKTLCCVGGNSLNMRVYMNGKNVLDATNPELSEGYDLTPYAMPGLIHVKIIYTNDRTEAATLSPLNLKVLNHLPTPNYEELLTL